MKTHTGEKAYECSQCNSSFSQKIHLEIHIRTHNKTYFLKFISNIFVEYFILYITPENDIIFIKDK